MEGWIKVHRRTLEWEWYTDGNTFRLFLHLLLKANHAPKKWRGILVDQGQLISGINKLSSDLNLSVQSVRTSLKKLKKTGEINTQSNSNYTIITICNYDYYQYSETGSNKQSNTPANKRVTNEQQTNNKRVTTNKNDKNIKKERIKEIKMSFVHPSFLSIWNEWLQYRKEIKKPYKTARGMQNKYEKLIKLSGEDPVKATAIIYQSINNEWMDFFELRNESTVNNSKPDAAVRRYKEIIQENNQ